MRIASYVKTGILGLILLIGFAVLPAAPARAAEDTEVQTTEDAELERSEEDAVLQGEDGKPAAPSGYVAPQEDRGLDASTGNLNWNLEGGVLTISGSGAMPDYSSSEPAPWYAERNSIFFVEIKDGVTSIGACAFLDCTNLETIQIADTVTSLGQAAFYNCSSLKQVDFPAGVTTLPAGLFYQCYQLTSVTMPGVTTVEDYAFQDTGLTTFTVSSKLTSLSGIALYLTPVTAYQVEAGNPVYQAKDGVLFTDQGTTLLAYPAGRTDASYTIPDGVTKIGDGAFLQSSNLTDISLGNQVTYLGTSAFQECNGLRAVTIPDSVTEVGDYTFYSCRNLQSLTFGNGLTSTSYQMFEKCWNLSDIHFGSRLTALGSRTFANNSALKEVSLPANITELGSGVFGNCSELTTFTSAGLTMIPFQGFLNDSSLVTLQVNEGVKEIARASFLGCTSLAEVQLPKSVKLVHSIAFPEETKITCLNPAMDAYGINGYRELDTVAVSARRSYNNAFEVLESVNEIRAQNGLSKLVMNESLLETAMQRAAEIAILFSHTRPDSSLCFDLNDQMKGENIACGQSTVAGVVDSWMSSPGHRENMLRDGYTSIGIGCVEVGGRYHWVQCFGTDEGSVDCSKPADQAVTEQIAIATEVFEEGQNTSDVIFGEVATYSYELGIQAPLLQLGLNTHTQFHAYLVDVTADMSMFLNDDSLVWESSDPEIATVENGMVRTMSRSGKVTITAKTKEGYYTASAEVMVGSSQLPFSDVGLSSWYYSSVEYVYNNGLMTGLNESTFGPGENLARAQLAVILYRLSGSPEVAYEDIFPDVPDGQWYTDAVIWAQEKGIVTGYSDSGTFKPGNNINRQEITTMMYRYAKYQGYSLEGGADYSSYPDAANVQEFAKDSMSWAVGNGIVTGKENPTRLDPLGNTARAECATIIMRFVEKYGK